MENIFVEFLPPWVETGLQPAFYDKESGTVLQQTARMYARVNMLIRMFNKLSKNTKETVENYINRFNELYNYVHDYFDNLDVQEEINNKLDAMTEAGTLQEIITAYIQSNVAWVFDTVADMKLAENLVAGSYAQTLGFYSANDGGGAIYYITDSGTANEMDVIAISSLYANLVYDDEINVKQLGAYGDNTHDDISVFTYAVSLAQSTGCTLYAPKGTYLLSTQLTAKHIIFRCDGELNNTETLVLGANSNGSTMTDVYIYMCKNIQIEGAKNSHFNFFNAGNITLYADGTDSTNTSIAYNIIDGIACTGITLNGVNNGWINENKFNIKRCNGDLTITGDGTYRHNNNRFYDVCIEGSTRKIKIDYGFCNYISFRGERLPVVTLSEIPTDCYGNQIQTLYASAYGNIFSPVWVNNNKTFNHVGLDYVPNLKAHRILDLNLGNVKHFDNTLAINNDGLITGGWTTEYINSNIEPDKPFTISLTSDVASQRIYVSCYNANDEIIEANVSGGGVIKDPATNIYRTTSDVKQSIVSYVPTDNVTRVEVKITTGGNTNKFKWVVADVYTPFTNLGDFSNNIDTTKKTRATSPASWTALSPTWEVGDIIYKTTPTAGGTIGWICTEAGTPGTWKEFGSIAS